MSNHTYAEESWFDPRLEVRRSGIDGRGMFATQPIRAGETVMVWGGIAFTLEEWVAGKVKLDPEAYTSSRIDDDLYIAAPIDGMDHYINHSCDPNLWMHDNITVVARRDIQPGAEVTFDYATIEAHDEVRFEQCNCGAPICRGSVRGDDWLNPELQARYHGHFQPWIMRMMAARATGAAPAQAAEQAEATTAPAAQNSPVQNAKPPAQESASKAGTTTPAEATAAPAARSTGSAATPKAQPAKPAAKASATTPAASSAPEEA